LNTKNKWFKIEVNKKTDYKKQGKRLIQVQKKFIKYKDSVKSLITKNIDLELFDKMDNEGTLTIKQLNAIKKRILEENE